MINNKCHILLCSNFFSPFYLFFIIKALDLQLKIEGLTVQDGNETIHLKDICLSPLKPLNSECAIQSLFGFFQNKAKMLEDKSSYLAHFKMCSG